MINFNFMPNIGANQAMCPVHHNNQNAFVANQEFSNETGSLTTMQSTPQTLLQKRLSNDTLKTSETIEPAKKRQRISSKGKSGNFQL